jgi:hypothetical protein
MPAQERANLEALSDLCTPWCLRVVDPLLSTRQFPQESSQQRGVRTEFKGFQQHCPRLCRIATVQVRNSDIDPRLFQGRVARERVLPKVNRLGHPASRPIVVCQIHGRHHQRRIEPERALVKSYGFIALAGAIVQVTQTVENLAIRRSFSCSLLEPFNGLGA